MGKVDWHGMKATFLYGTKRCRASFRSAVSIAFVYGFDCSMDSCGLCYVRIVSIAEITQKVTISMKSSDSFLSYHYASRLL
jgi:hypothetical protein